MIENVTFSVLNMPDRAVVEAAFAHPPFSSRGYDVFPLLSEPMAELAGRE